MQTLQSQYSHKSRGVNRGFSDVRAARTPEGMPGGSILGLYALRCAKSFMNASSASTPASGSAL
jgi:hypothetical protein